MSAPGRRQQGGFTLLELLVVLAVLGMVGGLVYPGLARAMQGQQFRSAAAASLAALRAARARAYATGATMRVAAGGGGGLLLASGNAPEALPAAVRVSVAPANGILFFGDGTSGGGRLTVTAPGARAVLVVAPATGLVRSAG